MRVAGVLRGIGGKVILHGGAHDIDIAASPHWPVISVTFSTFLSEVVDVGDKEVPDVPVSVELRLDDPSPPPVDELRIGSSPEAVDWVGNLVIEELVSVEW